MDVVVPFQLGGIEVEALAGGGRGVVEGGDGGFKDGFLVLDEF